MNCFDANAHSQRVQEWFPENGRLKRVVECDNLSSHDEQSPCVLARSAKEGVAFEVGAVAEEEEEIEEETDAFAGVEKARD